MADSEEPFPSALCNCSQKSAAPVHCPCSNCKGKAVHRRTQLNHIHLQKEIKTFSAPECDDSHENRAKDPDEDVEMNCEGKLFFLAQKCILWFIPRRNEGMMTCLLFKLI